MSTSLILPQYIKLFYLSHSLRTIGVKTGIQYALIKNFIVFELIFVAIGQASLKFLVLNYGKFFLIRYKYPIVYTSIC